MNAVGEPNFWRLWRSSLLWAVPASYLACATGIACAFVIGLIGDGYPDSIRDYVGAILVGFFLWGTIAFIATCYLTIPLLSLIIAAVRFGLSSRRYKRTAGGVPN